jgi:hypothetical protein
MKIRLTEAKLPSNTRKKLIQEFIKFCVKELELKKPYNCKVLLTDDKSKTQTYGHYMPSTGEIVVHLGDRSLNDVFRSLCHELCHHKQNQENRIKSNSGQDGTDIENEANSKAGVIMRKWGRLHPEAYEK